MTPRSASRPLNIALVLALCGVVLSARLLMGYVHKETIAPPEPAQWFGHYGELPPLW
jgi:hypothetical protein